MKLAYAKEMRHLDRLAIENYRIPGLLLMENAGAGTVKAMVDHFGDLTGRTVAIIAGPGNNGGDGLVIARHILQRGGLPLVFLLVDPDKLKGEAAVNLEIVGKLEIPLSITDDQEKIKTLANCLPGCDLIVDAIFGTGLTRKPAGHFATAMEIINSARCPVISVDLPSGLNSDTGQLLGPGVRAEMTTTYGLAKPGLFLGYGPEHTGKLEIIDIGLPPRALVDANLQTELLEAESVQAWLPSRPPTSNKGSFGHLLVVAGSHGMSGAALLCARGAIRSGVGLVSLVAPERLQGIFATALPEALTIPLTATTAGHVTPDDLDSLLAAARGKSAVVLGPGLGQDKGTGEVVAELYRRLEIPLLVDADGLNLLAARGTDLSIAPAPRILTPHPGEMSRLTGFSVDAIQADRLAVAREFATRNNIFLVLKGNGTVIAAPEGGLAINSTGNPLLATGGTGDVLAGLIGGLKAQGLSPWQSAGLAVFVHGRAADRHLDQDQLSSGLLASELADQVPWVMAELRNNKNRIKSTVAETWRLMV
jgi:ADP-dependent NAD(P)H-hydrate dehydratase / NAD(P)H-hydrate epimerase